MFTWLVVGAVLSAGPLPAQGAGAAPAETRCPQAAHGAGSPPRQGRGDAGRQVGGFLSSVAGRALAYAPPVDLGDSVLARVTAREIEGRAHEGAVSGLAVAQEKATASGTPPAIGWTRRAGAMAPPSTCAAGGS